MHKFAINLIAGIGESRKKNLQQTSKDFLHNDDIAINFDNITTTDDKELSNIFNKYYISIVQNTIGTVPVKISSKYEQNNDRLVIFIIIINHIYTG